MYNQYADEKIHSFEHQQRQRQAEMDQLAQIALRQAARMTVTTQPHGFLHQLLSGLIIRLRLTRLEA